MSRKATTLTIIYKCQHCDRSVVIDLTNDPNYGREMLDQLPKDWSVVCRFAVIDELSSYGTSIPKSVNAIQLCSECSPKAIGWFDSMLGTKDG